MSSSALPLPAAPASRERPRGSARPLLAPAVARAVALGALGVFCAAHWGALLEPFPTDRIAAAVLVAVAGAALLARCGQLPRGRWRRAALALVALGLLAGALASAGGRVGDVLWPTRWDDVAGEIGRGLEAVVGLRVPYAGLDDDARLVLLLGGTLGLALAAALAFWPRRGEPGRRWASVVCLLVVYAVPTVALDFDGQLARGAALALLVLAAARLERLRRRDAPAALVVALAAGALGIGAGGVLDRDEPLFAYEDWALEQASARTASFSWDHEYGPLDWPRDGREVLRIKARRDAYWKAQELDAFDGERWVSTGDAGAFSGRPPVAERGWVQTIRVSVRNLRTHDYIGAGTTLDILESSKGDERSPTPGVFQTLGRPLRRGDSYRARVYVPRPRRAAGAGADYSRGGPGQPYRNLRLPPAGPVPRPGAGAGCGRAGRGHRANSRPPRRVDPGPVGVPAPQRAPERLEHPRSR